MPAYFVSDGTHAVGQFGSTGGAFSLFANPFSSSHFMPGGGSLACSMPGEPGCPFGTFAITAGIGGDFGVADVTAGGVTYANAWIDTGGPGPSTSLHFTAEQIAITAAGSYAVPFSLTGQLQAATGVGGPFILDQQVSGRGYLYFSVSAVPGTPGYFSFDPIFAPGFPGGPATLRWVFVPEPSSLTMCAGGIALLLIAGARRGKT